MSDFKIDNVAIGLGNRDYLKRATMAELQLVRAGQRDRLFVRPDGEVVFPSSIPCPKVRAAVARVVRRKVLDQLAFEFARRDDEAPAAAAPPCGPGA